MSSEKIEIIDEVAMAVRKIGKFTERAPHQVILDALRVYDEVLEAWYYRKQVVILDEREGTLAPLENKDTIKW